MAELLYANGLTIAFSCLSENLVVLFKKKMRRWLTEGNGYETRQRFLLYVFVLFFFTLTEHKT